ncbi:CdaR family protein [Cohnella kolymensis]|uniref:CdaR family protein n=1 Tax=Cohnella kolymensis TaxID=1590652 RepID=UPI00069683A6|nr:CdaR family protein [Cohnella kolymensis]
MDRWLHHPTAVKIVALALGILMWAVVHFDQDQPSPSDVSALRQTDTIEGVKVEAYGLDERDFILLDMEPQTVALTVKGTPTDLLAAPKGDYRLRIDLRTVGAGEHTLNIKVESLPRGIQFVQMSPTTVHVNIQSLQTRELEADIRTEGDPAQGYKAGLPVIKPSNRVHVTLPSDQWPDVARVGANISIEGAQEALENKSVKLAAYDSAGKVIEGARIDPEVLEVDIPITNPFKTVPLQFRFTGTMPAELSIAAFKPEVEQVTIYGPQQALDKIDFIEAHIQVNNLTKSGNVAVPLKVTTPITQISPEQVKVDVDIVLAATRSLEGLPITLKGLGGGLRAKISEPSTGKADITIKGAPSMLDHLQPGDVGVVADLSGKGPGTHTIPLIVNLPRFIEQAGGTNSITVQIEDDVPADAPLDSSGAPAGQDSSPDTTTTE